MRSQKPLAAAITLALCAGESVCAGVGLVPIFEIQGPGHTSPRIGEVVRTSGIVTALQASGFSLQDPTGDGNRDTSDGIFILSTSLPAVAVGDLVEVEGLVEEFKPGGESSHNLTVTRLRASVVVSIPAAPPAPLPDPVVLGPDGLQPPASVIDDDNFLSFDPESDGIDFFEALEGMRVTLQAPVVVCPSNEKAEMYVVVDGGKNASGMSARGTLNLSPDDYNPERIQVQEKLEPGPTSATLNVGDQLGDVTGVLGYDGMYEVLTVEPVTMTPGGITPGTTTLPAHPGQLRVASYQLAGLDAKIEDPSRLLPELDPDEVIDDDLGDGTYDRIAAHIVDHLGTPDIVALQGILDDDGAELTANLRSHKTLLVLLNAITQAGGPSYYYALVDPSQAAFVDDRGTPNDPGDDELVNPSGSIAGGNQRNVFLYNPERVTLVPGSTMALADPDPTDGDAFGTAPLPLQASFRFGGEEITLVNVHFSERTGGASLFGDIQPATELQDNPLVNGGVDRRMAQATALSQLVQASLAADPQIKLAVLGNFNESEFLATTRTLSSDLTNLTEMIEERERYTVISDGNSMSLDHVLVTGSLLREAPRFEIIHVNCEFATANGRASDHDPVLASFALSDPVAFEHRTIDGFGNNLTAPARGQAGQIYIRTTAGGTASFEDGLDYPRGSTPLNNPDPLAILQSDLPSPRRISNVLSQHPAGVESAARLSSWTWQWGQFIDHDFGLTAGHGSGAPAEFFPIPVPSGDPYFDPSATGTRLIPFTRSGVFPGTGITSQRETPNLITSFLDGSNVYGSDDLRALNLRTFSGGLLATQAGPDGELLPFNLFGRTNANDTGLPPTSLFLAGDIRANEQCGLTAAHTLFVREHNRLAARIAAEQFPGADLRDPAVDQEIYQRARKFVGALIQNITYREFLPAILGPAALPPYPGYRPEVDPSLSQEFANGAFRVGHTMVTAELLRFDQQGNPHPAGPLPLRHAFFNPPEITGIGIDPYLRGLARQRQQEIDRFVIEDVRSFLFGPPGSGGLDLAALNIQRGRDHGLPPLNAVRASLGLPPALDYEQITSEAEASDGLRSLYSSGNVDAVDLWIGGICEDHLPGSQLGMTFHAVWVDQFTRLRDGDRFWFESDPFFSPEEVREIQQTTLADVIHRNSSARVQSRVFHVPTPRLEITTFEFERATNTVTLTWRSEGGESFEIQASDHFAQAVPFTTVATATGEAGLTTIRFVDPAAAGKPHRAYRVVRP